VKRSAALAAALAVVLSGSGLPMCVSLLARAAEPCPMHQHQRGGPGAEIVAGHDMDGGCHSDAGDVGCATGGTCPTGGAAAPVAAEAVLATSRPTRAVTPELDQAHLSFVSPPLPPPPQG